MTHRGWLRLGKDGRGESHGPVARSGAIPDTHNGNRQMTIMPRKQQEAEPTYQGDALDSELAKMMKVYAKTDFTSLIRQIETEYTLAWFFIKPKWDEWALRLKLYNNQRRDKEAIGDPLMFTIHQTILASLYSDRLLVDFRAREKGDEEVAEVLNRLAENDEEEMQKEVFDYEWDWDASFFGRGLSLFNDFDRKTLTPIPECIDIMTWLRDPQAKSVNGDRRGRGAMRFGGREVRLTGWQMSESGIYFNTKGLAADGTDISSLVDANSQARSLAQGLGDVTKMAGMDTENADFRILEWFTIWKGKKVLVGMVKGSGRKKSRIVRYTELGPANGPWPLIDRPIYPIAHDWDGVSIPDLSEDKQRGRSVVQNLGIRNIKAGLEPMYVYDTTRIKNRGDLNFGFNKHIPIDGRVEGAIAPIDRPGIKQEVQWIMDVLDTAAQRATATPEIQQGQVSKTERTFGEISLAASKVDTRYSLTAKVFGWSEKVFWHVWRYLYKEHFDDKIDEKSIRIVGASGAVWRKLTKDNIIGLADPDIVIESRAVSEAQKFQKVAKFRQFMRDVSALDPTFNVRFASRRYGSLIGISKDEVDQLLPPNYDELHASEENVQLSDNKMQHVDPVDDDLTHIDIHSKAADTPAKYAHIQAHKKAMMLKKAKPDLFPKSALPGGQFRQMLPPPNDLQLANDSIGSNQQGSYGAPPKQ